MSLTRYEFELLSFLEKAGEGDYLLRDLSDSLCISGSQVQRDLDKAVENGWIARNNGKGTDEKRINGEGIDAKGTDGKGTDGQNKDGQPAVSVPNAAPTAKMHLSLTSSGLEALEPYRVQRAVIMAAGFGSRMLPATSDRPKPMVTVNGVRIIETLLDALTAVGITDITLVRGYKKERFDELLPKYPFLKLIDNDDYDKTNNISSAILALDKIDRCYLCEADLYITDPSIITKYQYASNILGSWSLETDDWSFRRVDGYIDDYRKGNTYCYNYYGISFWTEEDSAKLRRDFRDIFDNAEGGKDYFWEFVPLVLKHDEYKVEIRPCRKQAIMEIDNYYELAQLDPTYKME